MKTIGILGELIPEERVFDNISESKVFINEEIKTG